MTNNCHDVTESTIRMIVDHSPSVFHFGGDAIVAHMSHLDKEKGQWWSDFWNNFNIVGALSSPMFMPMDSVYIASVERDQLAREAARCDICRGRG